MTMEYPTHVSKAYMNPSSRRKGNKGKQTWRVYGYDNTGHFRTERIEGSIFGLKPRMKLYIKRTTNCTECGKRGDILIEKKHDRPICLNCKWNMV